VIVELKQGEPRAYRFSDPESAKASLDINRLRLREGGSLVFSTPTPRGIFMTVHGADRVATIRVAGSDEVDAAGIAVFDADKQ
jgi:hypothetical protein